MHSDLKLKIFECLDALQFADIEQFIVFRPVPCGLGGQIHGRIVTLSLALALGRKAIFLSLEDPPYKQVFQPLFSGPTPMSVIDSSDTLANLWANQLDRVVSYDPLQMETECDEFTEILLKKISMRIGSNCPSRMHLEGIIFTWMKRITDVEDYCLAEISRLGVDGDTLGVHFRRGDKSVESAFVPASVINAEIERLHSLWPFKKLFLASDSPFAVREIVCPQGVELIFDLNEPRHNNANHKMLIASPQLAESETHIAFKNIRLLSECGGVVGQSNAHFAVIAASVICGHDGSFDKISLIDGHIAEKRSRLIASLFAVKRRLRKVVKTFLPQFTMSGRRRPKDS